MKFIYFPYFPFNAGFFPITCLSLAEVDIYGGYQERMWTVPSSRYDIGTLESIAKYSLVAPRVCCMVCH